MIGYMKVYPYIILSAWKFISQFYSGIPSFSCRPGKYEHFPLFGPKFYTVPFPTQKVTDSEFLYKCFVINVLQFQFFAKPSMDFIQLWRDDRALSKIVCCTIPISVLDIKVKATDFDFFLCVNSLQCQLLQSL